MVAMTELERRQQELLALPKVRVERETEKLQHLAVNLRNILLNMAMANLTPGRDLYIAVTQKLPRSMLTRFVESYQGTSTNVGALSTWLMHQIHTLRQVEARLEGPGQDAKKVAAPLKPPQAAFKRNLSSNWQGASYVLRCSISQGYYPSTRKI